MKKKAIGIALAVIVAGVLTWHFAWNRTVTPPDAASAPAKSVRDYLASEDFARLPGDAQAACLEKFGAEPPERMKELMDFDKMPAAEKKQLTNNVRRGFIRVIVKRANEYEALPAEKRDAYLDAQMQEMMSRMQQMRALQPAGGSTSAGPPWMGGRMNADQMQQFFEEMLSATTPAERANLEEFRGAMMQRMVTTLGFPPMR